MSKRPETSGRLDGTCKRTGILGYLDVRLNVLGNVDISYMSKRTLTYLLRISKVYFCEMLNQ